MPSLLTRKAKVIKPLIDYNKSYVVTSIEYLETGIEKEVIEHIKEGNKNGKRGKQGKVSSYVT
jgi:hypothetical protein